MWLEIPKKSKKNLHFLCIWSHPYLVQYHPYRLNQAFRPHPQYLDCPLSLPHQDFTLLHHLQGIECLQNVDFSRFFHFKRSRWHSFHRRFNFTANNQILPTFHLALNHIQQYTANHKKSLVFHLLRETDIFTETYQEYRSRHKSISYHSIQQGHQQLFNKFNEYSSIQGRPLILGFFGRFSKENS